MQAIDFYSFLRYQKNLYQTYATASSNIFESKKYGAISYYYADFIEIMTALGTLCTQDDMKDTVQSIIEYCSLRPTVFGCGKEEQFVLDSISRFLKETNKQSEK